MNSSTQTKIGLVLVVVALLAGYWVGTSHQTTFAAEGGAAAKVEPGFTGAIGVSIPSGGAAVVKGKDGFAYVIDSRGVFVRASQSGKGLELP